MTYGDVAAYTRRGTLLMRTRSSSYTANGVSFGAQEESTYAILDG